MHEGFIRTLSGLLAPDELGFCQCHEHLYIKGEIEDYDLSLKELTKYKEAGGSAMVDAQPRNAGSDFEILKKLSCESGVYVIASTGFHKLLYYNKDSDVYTESKTVLAGHFVQDIEYGAGIIKTAACGKIEGIYEKLHESAALAAAETGSPVICHIDRDTSLIEVISFYSKYGVDPSRLILCHADRFVPDMYEHEKAATLGAYLEYDTVARYKYHSDDEEIRIIRHMLDKGYINSILLSLDTTLSRLKDIGLSYLIRTFIPQLKENSVNDREIDLITVSNCRDALSFK